MAQHWEIDERSGDYLMSDGSPIQTESLRIPAYNRLKIKRNNWLYNPGVDYGSDFYQIKKRQTNRDTSLIENTAARGLQPLLDDGRARRIDIEFESSSRNAVSLKIRIISASGEIQELQLNPLGA